MSSFIFYQPVWYMPSKHTSTVYQLINAKGFILRDEAGLCAL